MYQLSYIYCLNIVIYKYKGDIFLILQETKPHTLLEVDNNETDNEEAERNSFYEEWNKYTGYHASDEWYLDPQ